MSDYERFLTTLPDGTIRQKNPFTGTEVWTVRDRKSKPAQASAIANQYDKKKDPEDYCDLCEGRYLNTPPEKERLARQGSEYISLRNLCTEELSASKPAFRRIPNLFEITAFDFWQKNYGSTLSPDNRRRKEEYISNEKSRLHLLNVINLKLRRLGRNPEDVPEKEKLSMSDSFFGGGHDLIVAGTHFVDDSWPTPRLFSSCEMSPDEHFHFFKFTISGMAACYDANPAVRYVVVFQNWLKPAGASFDHLHKQIVAMDRAGTVIDLMLNAVRRNEKVFNELGPVMARELRLLITENEHALAFADIGHVYPTITIQSKSRTSDPCRFNDDELRGMSDLVHAIHVAIGGSVSCNEEWYYAPRSSGVAMPWQIRIKLRINTPAGFENITGICLSPIDPFSLKDQLVRQLQDAKARRTTAESTSLQET